MSLTTRAVKRHANARQRRRRTAQERWIGNSNGIFARCLWERTPGAPPTWTPHHILVPLFSSSSLLKYFACILLICAV